MSPWGLLIYPQQIAIYSSHNDQSWLTWCAGRGGRRRRSQRSRSAAPRRGAARPACSAAGPAATPWPCTRTRGRRAACSGPSAARCLGGAGSHAPRPATPGTHRRNEHTQYMLTIQTRVQYTHNEHTERTHIIYTLMLTHTHT